MQRLFNDRQWRFLYKLHCYGYTYKEISEWLHISPNTVQYNFYRLGLKCFEREPMIAYDTQFEALGDDDRV